MAGVVYLLCAFTSLVCAWLLYRAYSHNKFRLLFWCCLGFTGFSINNILLFIDIIVLPQVDYIINFRTIPALIGMLVMIYGLIMEEV